MLSFISSNHAQMAGGGLERSSAVPGIWYNVNPPQSVWFADCSSPEHTVIENRWIVSTDAALPDL